MRWVRSGNVIVRESVGSRWRGFIGHGVGVASAAAGILALTPLAAGVRGLAFSVALAVGALLMLVLGLTWPNAVVMRISPPTVRVWSGMRRVEAIPLASIVSVSSMSLPPHTEGVSRIPGAGPNDLVVDSNASRAVRIEYRGHSRSLQTLIFVTESVDAVLGALRRPGVPQAADVSSPSA